MITINLSSCKSRKDIHQALLSAVADKEIVSGRLEARRRFREQNIKGRVHENVVFRDRREVHQIGPLHRDVFVCSMITRYFINGAPGVEFYAVDVVAY